MNRKLPPTGGPTVIFIIVGGILQVQGVMKVILPPKGEPNGLEISAADAVSGITKTPITANKTISDFIEPLYLGDNF